MIGAELLHIKDDARLLAKIISRGLKSSGGKFYGVSPGIARREAVDAFKMECVQLVYTIVCMYVVLCMCKCLV